MSDKLTEIMAHKRIEIRDRVRPVREEELSRFAAGDTGRLSRALRDSEEIAVIAEIKRRSPSAGDISAGLDAVEQARHYINGEADGLSILTDEKYFGGSLRDLWDVTDFLRDRGRPTPCLRKDFMVDPIQVLEAAEAGASAILLIVRALSIDELKRLREAADLAGLDSLYEIHSEEELETALSLDPRIVGVNNRDLSRFVTDLALSEALIPQIPDDIVTVSESGIFTGEDAGRAREAGADAILVGEGLVRAEDPAALIREFKEA
ncbi:indole-3-glycerol phosphate synthase TrpC [Puniceicoccus vermicola]|uniref:indole-3-glycerol-phosphate synthase n=1 Tax=Puniceicoccus vermicola TaxID=388746 RepID=A0A7X1B1H0_9BACT|nr:indole-3-glycerol phosphate synthase TrpC [Puniceicoccus vermicola]MBC2603878.1 indole-3-glycerol-phosphate synthase [Puniceicoccus vermicola]